eukprot:5140761-Pyramimonas_sp.AAC.1
MCIRDRFRRWQSLVRGAEGSKLRHLRDIGGSVSSASRSEDRGRVEEQSVKPPAILLSLSLDISPLSLFPLSSLSLSPPHLVRAPSLPSLFPVSYTHLRAHETGAYP